MKISKGQTPPITVDLVLNPWLSQQGFAKRPRRPVTQRRLATMTTERRIQPRYVLEQVC
jgi:hypothetical protein